MCAAGKAKGHLHAPARLFGFGKLLIGAEGEICWLEAERLGVRLGAVQRNMIPLFGSHEREHGPCLAVVLRRGAQTLDQDSVAFGEGHANLGGDASPWPGAGSVGACLEGVGTRQFRASGLMDLDLDIDLFLRIGPC